jgi:hypothetical protein
MYWTPQKIEKVKEVMLQADSYDSAVMLLKRHDIITNRGVLSQIVHKLRQSGEIKTPLLKHGGKRQGCGRRRLN